jgi:hypothetical protein
MVERSKVKWHRLVRVAEAGAALAVSAGILMLEVLLVVLPAALRVRLFVSSLFVSLFVVLAGAVMVVEFDVPRIVILAARPLSLSLDVLVTLGLLSVVLPVELSLLAFRLPQSLL